LKSEPGNHYPQMFSEARFIVSTILGKVGNAEVLIWDLDTNTTQRHPAKGLTTMVMIGTDRNKYALIATGRLGGDWTAKVFDMRTQEIEREFQGKHGGMPLFAPDLKSYGSAIMLNAVRQSSVTMFDADTSAK